MAAAYALIVIAAYLFVAFAHLGVFKKADVPAWYAFVPIVQTYGILKTVGRQWWWLLLIYLLPCIGLIFFIIVMNDLSTSFAKGGGFTVGLVFLFGIFLFILGYGSAEYHGPIASIPPGLPPGDLAP